MPFVEADALFFFGRETERDNVTYNLLGSRLTLLYGATGTGKSSLLRAGVAYRLGQLSRDNMKLKDTPEFIPVVFNSWQGNPVHALCHTIERAVRGILGNVGPEGDRTTDSLEGTIELWSHLAQSDLLIILDQFEEYFLYHGHEQGAGSFYSEFPRAVNRPDLRASFLISLREDALAKIDLFKERIPKLFHNYIRVGHLDRDGAHDAIRKPLLVYSHMVGAEPAFTIEEEAVDEVCKQIQVGRRLVGDAGSGATRSEPATTYVETSFLQLVMTRLWEKEVSRGSRHLRLATLKMLGGAANIVRTHLDVSLQHLPSGEQEAAAEIFRYLVTPSGTKIAFSASDLVEYTQLPEALVDSVLEKLCAADVRILRPFYINTHKRREKNYEIFHDVLAPAILDWRARYTQEKERSRIEREAREFQEAEGARLREEVERRRQEGELRLVRAKRRTRQLLVILTLSAFITAALTALFFYASEQRRKALLAMHESETQRVEAQKMLDIVNSLDSSVAYFQAVMRGHTEPVLTVDFSPDQTQVVTASADNTARIWEADSGRLVAELKGHTATVRSALFSPDGTLIATAGNDGTARVWEADSGRPLYVLEGHTKEVSVARFSPDGRLLVTASDDGTARVWEATTGQQIKAFSGHPGAVTSAAFSSDGRRVVTAGTDGTVRVWELSTGNYILLAGHGNAVNTAMFSPDGRLVVSASSDWDARIWDLNNGQNYSLKGHAGPVNSAAFSPDGTLIVTASDDHTARVWDVKTRRALKVLEGHAEAVLSASFSDDSSRVITASADKTALVWEASSGRVLFELRGHTDAIKDAVIGQAGKLAATAGQDKTARTWDISGAGGIRIRDVSVNVAPDSYSGPCPVRVKISANITATGSGTIIYRFVRSSGYVGGERTLRFETSSTKEVSTTWLFGSRSTSNTSGNFQLEITSPQIYLSKKVSYIIRCQAPFPDVP
jgi:WD40 repeat protein